MRRIALTATAGISFALGAGCSTVRPSVAAPKVDPSVTRTAEPPSTESVYSKGSALRVFAATSAALHPAILAAMEDLQIRDVKRSSDSGVTLFQGTSADNRRVSLTLRKPLPGSTRLTVRIGLFGDEPMSKALIERIGIRLGELPPAPIPTVVPSAPASNPFINFSRTLGPDSDLMKDLADSLFRDSTVP